MGVKTQDQAFSLKQASIEGNLKRAETKDLSLVILQTSFKNMTFHWSRMKNLLTFCSSPNNQ